MTWLLAASLLAASPCTVRGASWQGAELETDAGVLLGPSGPTGPVVLSRRAGRWVVQVDVHDLTLDVFTRSAVALELVSPVRIDDQVVLDRGFDVQLQVDADSAQVSWPTFLADAGLPNVELTCQRLQPAAKDEATCVVEAGGCRALAPTESEAMAWARREPQVGVVFPGGREPVPLLLRAAPAGERGLRLAPTLPWPVRLLARKGTWQQVSLRRDAVVVTGWVREDEVVPFEAPPKVQSPLALTGEAGRKGCRRSTRLFARSSAGLEAIGQLKPGARAQAVATDGDLVLVRGLGFEVIADGGVTLALKREDAAGCLEP